MDSFAFMIHPIDPKRDVSRKFPLLGRILNERAIHFLSAYFPPIYLSEIEGITSQATGQKIKGWLIACPFTSQRMMTLPERIVYRKIIQTGRLAERLGAKLLGLGATTSVVGDAGVTIAQALRLSVTTGASYTVATSLQAVRQAAARLGLVLESTTAAVVGATGTIGRACADILADEVHELLLIARKTPALEALQKLIQVQNPRALVRVTTAIEDLQEAQIIISVTSATHQVIKPATLRPGSIICDVALPRDVSRRAALAREDILVIDGGIVRIPGTVNFNFDFGLPPGFGYACMAETIALSLEGRFENFTLGKHVTRTQVEEITRIAQKHGFQLGDLQSFAQPIEDAKYDFLLPFAQGKRSARRV